MILTLHLLNNAVSLSRGITQSIEEVERFMRHDFNKKMLQTGETMTDYLGIWEKNQKKFQLMSGQKRILRVISEYCQSLYPIPDIPITSQSSDKHAKDNVNVPVPSSSKLCQQASKVQSVANQQGMLL